MQWMSTSWKGYATLSTLSSLFAGSTRDFKSQTITSAHTVLSTLTITKTFFVNCRSYVSTSLGQPKDDGIPSIHWNTTSDQPRDGLRYQNCALDRHRDSEIDSITVLDIRRSKRTRRRKTDQWRENERFCLIWRNKNIHSQWIDNRSIVVFEMGYRQTKYICPVWQTLFFQSRERYICIIPAAKRKATWLVCKRLSLVLVTICSTNGVIKTMIKLLRIIDTTIQTDKQCIFQGEKW